jgi:hypothetical protein
VPKATQLAHVDNGLVFWMVLAFSVAARSCTERREGEKILAIIGMGVTQ